MKGFFNSETVNGIARESGYCKRMGKLSPYNLLCLLISEHHRKDEVSLADYTWELLNTKKIKLSEEGLNKKFSELGVKFMEDLLNAALDKLFNSGSSRCEGSIRIKDSTSFQCPESMCVKFKGSGGSSSSAGIKIQFDYGVTDGKIYALKVGEMAKPDISDAMENNHLVNEGDVMIQDLGYIGVEALEKIESNEGGYLNRLQKCNVYEWKEGEMELLDFKLLYKTLKKRGGKAIDKEVYITAKQMRTRLIASLVPEHVYAERVRKQRKIAKKKGYTVKENTLFKLKFDLYITNLPCECIKAEEVRNIYRLRWQIELVFKAWKSYEHLGKIKDVKPERVLMELYAKLIWILLKTRIEHEIVQWGRDNDIPMSKLKVHKRLSKYAAFVWDGLKSLFKMLLEHVDELPKRLRKEIKKSKDGLKHNCERTLKNFENSLTVNGF